MTWEASAEYDLVRDKIWTIQRNGANPLVFRYPGFELDPRQEEYRLQVQVPSGDLRLGLVASNGNQIFALRPHDRRGAERGRSLERGERLRRYGAGRCSAVCGEPAGFVVHDLPQTTGRCICPCTTTSTRSGGWL